MFCGLIYKLSRIIKFDAISSNPFIYSLLLMDINQIKITIC